MAKPGPVPASFVKNYELVTKRADLDRAEFDRYWAQVHGPLAATIPTIRRYVQAHLSAGTRQGEWGTRADEANFLAGELPFVITTERTTYPRT